MGKKGEKERRTYSSTSCDATLGGFPGAVFMKSGSDAASAAPLSVGSL